MQNEKLNSDTLQKDNQSSFEALAGDRDLAERVKNETFYAGLFVDREELYKNAPAHLKNTIENPHVTTKFAPNEMDLHLDELGTKAKIFAIGYGNNGKNEGLLVKVEAEDPVIQKAIDNVETPHITLSYSDDSHPKYTSDLEFTPIEQPFELTGEYCLYLKDNQHKRDSHLLNNTEDIQSII